MRLIDADAIKENVDKSIFDVDDKEWYLTLLANAPTIEPKQGEWISLHNGKWKCSECGIEVLIYAKGNFCPNCGARMKEADDE